MFKLVELYSLTDVAVKNTQIKKLIELSPAKKPALVAPILLGILAKLGYMVPAGTVTLDRG